MHSDWQIHKELEEALQRKLPIVALESAFLTHGLPFPTNLDTAQKMAAAIRQEQAVPAMLAVVRGRVHIGVPDEMLQDLAQSQQVRKASTRDLAGCIVRRETAGLTVAASALLAAQAGIRVLATGGIGGVHRCFHRPCDISPDLFELARRAVAVVCSGAKSLMDAPATLELLETLGIPALSWGTPSWPAFLLADSGLKSPDQCDDVGELASLVHCHWVMGGAGVLVAVPPPQGLDPEVHDRALQQALQEAESTGVTGPALTPFVLNRLAELTHGRSLAINQALLVNNARHAAVLARYLAVLAAARHK